MEEANISSHKEVEPVKDYKDIKKIFLIGLVVIVYTYYAILASNEKPIEEYGFSSAFGVDLYKDSTGTVKYSIPFSIYAFQGGNRQFSSTKIGEASTGAETRQNRQLISDKQFLIGSQKLIVYSESLARYGMKYNADIQLNSPTMNDRGRILVCKGKTEDILNYKVKGYSNSSEYIEGMVKSSTNSNFFSKEYTTLNMYVRLDTEGMNIVLPYIEITDTGLKFTGMALFKGDKMIRKIDIEESKFMNIMREDDVKGILSIQKNSDEFMNFYAITRKKVKCNKINDKYEFQININIEGDVIVNTLFKDIDKKAKDEIEKTLAKDVEKKCNEFIDKMQNEYKVDCLELGMYAVAKNSRDAGVDWNQVICDSSIKVKANVKLDKVGRGAY